MVFLPWSTNTFLWKEFCFLFPKITILKCGHWIKQVFVVVQIILSRAFLLLEMAKASHLYILDLLSYLWGGMEIRTQLSIGHFCSSNHLKSRSRISKKIIAGYNFEIGLKVAKFWFLIRFFYFAFGFQAKPNKTEVNRRTKAGVLQSLRMEGSNLSEISVDFQNFGGLLFLRISKWGRLQSLRILDFSVKNALLY